MLLIVFVPLAHFQTWLAVRKGSTQRGTLLGLSNALTIGVSIFYTIVYIPLLPLGFIALLFAGLGLLPMAPILSLVSGLILRRQLRQTAPANYAVRWRGLVAGLATAFAAIVLMEMPATRLQRFSCKANYECEENIKYEQSAVKYLDRKLTLSKIYCVLQQRSG